MAKAQPAMADVLKQITDRLQRLETQPAQAVIPAYSAPILGACVQQPAHSEELRAIKDELKSVKEDVSAQGRAAQSRHDKLLDQLKATQTVIEAQSATLEASRVALSQLASRITQQRRIPLKGVEIVPELKGQYFDHSEFNAWRGALYAFVGFQPWARAHLRRSAHPSELPDASYDVCLDVELASLIYLRLSPQSRAALGSTGWRGSLFMQKLAAAGASEYGRPPYGL